MLFINSTKSGKSELNIKNEEIINIYKSHGRLSDIQVVNTEYKGHIGKIINDFKKEDIEEKIAIILGGDGSLNELANNAYASDIKIGLIPTGTGNDFAKNFNYRNFKIEDTLDYYTKPIDLIRINDKICINIASLGFDTQVLKKAYDLLDENPKLGKKAYIRSVIHNLLHVSYENLYFDLEKIDGSRLKFNGDFLISAICNGSFYGSGFNPAPDTKIDDGYLNLVLAKKIPYPRLIPLVIKYKKGVHQNSKYLSQILVKKGTISSKNGFIGNIDGEIFSCKEIKFEILPAAIDWVYFKK